MYQISMSRCTCKMADVSFILDEAEATIRRIADSSANGFSDMDGVVGNSVPPLYCPPGHYNLGYSVPPGHYILGYIVPPDNTT